MENIIGGVDDCHPWHLDTGFHTGMAALGSLSEKQTSRLRQAHKLNISRHLPTPPQIADEYTAPIEAVKFASPPMPIEAVIPSRTRESSRPRMAIVHLALPRHSQPILRFMRYLRISI